MTRTGILGQALVVAFLVQAARADEEPLELTPDVVGTVEVAPEITWYKLFGNGTYMGRVRVETGPGEDGELLFKQDATYPQAGGGEIRQQIVVRFTPTLQARGFRQNLEYDLPNQKRTSLTEGNYVYSEGKETFLLVRVTTDGKAGKWKKTQAPEVFMPMYVQRFVLLRAGVLKVGKGIRYRSFSTTANKFVLSTQRVAAEEDVEVAGRKVKAFRVESESEAMSSGGRFVMWALPISKAHPNGQVLLERQETPQGTFESRLTTEEDARKP